MSEHKGNYENDKPKPWGHDQFKGAIIEAVQGHDIPKSRIPEAIDLTGNIGSKCDALLTATLADPRRRERASYAKVTPEGKFLLKKDDILGEETQVVTHLDLNENIISTIDEALFPQYRPNEYHALSIHTHGIIQKPPSLPDVLSLLKSTIDGGSQAVMVLTKDTRYLIMKTLDTPDLSDTEIKAWASNKQASLSNGFTSQVKGYLSFMRQRGIPVSDESLNAYEGRADTEAQMRLLYQVCREMHIELRIATGNSNNYTKENATAMAKLVGIDAS